MKRLLAVLLVVLLLGMPVALAALPAAEVHTVTTEMAEVTFTAPQGMECLTLETSASVFRRLGLSQREYFAYMKENSIIALLIDPATGQEYDVYAYPWDAFDLDDLDETEAQLVCADTLRAFRESGYTVEHSGIYRGDGHAWLISDMRVVEADGTAYELLVMQTCQAGCQVEVVAYPPAGEMTDSFKVSAKAFADGVAIMPLKLSVSTQELPDGDFALTLGKTRLVFTPIDVRFSMTRESSAYVFNRMGYLHEEELAIMEDYDIFAILYDRHQRARVQVHVLDEPESQDYAGMMDWMMKAAEGVRLTDAGWKIEKSEVLKDSGLPFVKSTITYTHADGTTEYRMLYGSCIGGARLEIQVIASGVKTLELVEAQTDEFVRGIRKE